MLENQKETKEDKIGVNIRIGKIEEIAYNCSIPENLGADIDPAQLRIKFFHDFKTDITTDKFDVTVSVIYVYINDVLIEFTIKVIYYIDNLSSYLEINGASIRVIPDFIPILLNTAIGALRGMLVQKTAATVLSDFPIPLIDINQFLQKPI